MDFNNTGLQSILTDSVQHKNVKLIMTVNKAEELINMIASTFRNEPYKKMLVDQYQNLIITSDTNKILGSVKLVHPIQFLLRDILSKTLKIGDGNTFLVLLLGKILNKCRELLIKGMKADQIIDSLKFVKNFILEKIDQIKEKKNADFTDSSFLKSILNPILKDDFLVDILSEAVIKSKLSNSDNIRIQKVYTGSFDDSFVVPGMFIENSIDTNMYEKSGNVAIFNTSLDIERSETKATILFEKADEMLSFSRDEDKSIENLVNSISENTDILFFNGSVNEQFVEYFNNKGVMVVKVISKFDLKRLMRMTGAGLLQNIRKPQENELGKADQIKTVYQGNKKFLQIEKNDSNVVSIVLTDSLKSNIDEAEILLEKGIKSICNMKNENVFVLKGSGILENELSQFLDDESKKISDFNKHVFKAISKVLKEFYDQIEQKKEDLNDSYITKRNAYEAAFDVAAEVMSVEDYLVSKSEKPPQ